MLRRSIVVCFLSWILGSNPTYAEHLAYTDAEVLALEITVELVPPAEVVERIERDLAAIRTLDPLFENIRAVPMWEPGEILVLLTPEAWDAYEQGTFLGLDALNQQFGPVELEPLFESLRILRLNFTRPYHPMRLSALYAQAEGVDSASPNLIPFNGTGRDIRSHSVGTYTFVFGWGGCVPQCPFEHYWTFGVDEEGRVALLEQGGPPLSVRDETWSNIKARYR